MLLRFANFKKWVSHIKGALQWFSTAFWQSWGTGEQVVISPLLVPSMRKPTIPNSAHLSLDHTSLLNTLILQTPCRTREHVELFATVVYEGSTISTCHSLCDHGNHWNYSEGNNTAADFTESEFSECYTSGLAENTQNKEVKGYTATPASKCDYPVWDNKCYWHQVAKPAILIMLSC